MDTGLSFQYSPWLIIVCLAAGLAYAALLYYRDKTFGDNTAGFKYWKPLMAAARFMVVTALAILLLSPFIRARTTQKFKPIVAVISDNSESMRNGLGKDTAGYQAKMRALIASLSDKYEVATFTAGDQLRSGIRFNYTDKSTNLSSALEDINSQYYNQNLGAVVLASDGIYNKGVNPVYAATNATYSIYTIALGDTTVRKDQKIANVFYNRIAYLNDQFGLRVDVQADNCAGKTVKMNIEQVEGPEAKPVQNKDITYSSDNFYQSFDFVIPANKVGIAHYRVTLAPLPGEASLKNNSRDIFVEVLDGRQKILMVANSPHPDVAALKTAIENNKNYQLDVEYADAFSRKLNDYNLIILHQLPSAANKVLNILKDARDIKKPVLFIVGSQTSLTDFQRAQNALIIKGNADKFNDVAATVSKDFSLFTLSDKTVQSIAKFPPFSCFFGEYSVNPASKVLLKQRINSVETDYPLWLFNETGDNKTGIICGEGLWRWRLYDYLLNKNQDATNELINKTIQFLSVKADKRPFRVNLQKNIFEDNEAITFDAQLYNANYELVNAPDVEMDIAGDNGQNVHYKFGKTENAYNLNAGFLPVGSYSYKAHVKLGNSDYTAEGKFSVSPLQLEDLRTRADYQVLYQLASQHNGAMHYLNDMDKIAGEINGKNQLKPVLYDTFSTQSAIEIKWILILVLLLLSLEWFLRKYLGGY